MHRTLMSVVLDGRNCSASHRPQRGSPHEDHERNAPDTSFNWTSVERLQSMSEDCILIRTGGLVAVPMSMAQGCGPILKALGPQAPDQSRGSPRRHSYRRRRPVTRSWRSRFCGFTSWPSEVQILLFWGHLDPRVPFTKQPGNPNSQSLAAVLESPESAIRISRRLRACLSILTSRACVVLCLLGSRCY